jgi:hypothetical protein
LARNKTARTIQTAAKPDPAPCCPAAPAVIVSDAVSDVVVRVGDEVVPVVVVVGEVVLVVPVVPVVPVGPVVVVV